jgi:DNA-binding MarR family transcriptional regulator
LAVALKRLRSRLREESGTAKTGLTISQLAVLQRIVDGGAVTAASLAAAEHVSQQAIAQSLATLKAEGLVAVKPDPGDGRKNLLSATRRGRAMSTALFETRDAWLARAIETVITPDERATVEKAIEMLERLADADLSPAVGIR